MARDIRPAGCLIAGASAAAGVKVVLEAERPDGGDLPRQVSGHGGPDGGRVGPAGNVVGHGQAHGEFLVAAALVRGTGCAHAAMQEVLVRGLVQAPVPGAQRLDKITRFRKGDPLLERDVNVAAAVGGVVLNPAGTDRVQPGLDGADVGLDPVDTGDGGVKVEEDRRAGAVFTENPDGRRERGKASVRVRSCFCGYVFPASRESRTRGWPASRGARAAQTVAGSSGCA